MLTNAKLKRLIADIEGRADVMTASLEDIATEIASMRPDLDAVTAEEISHTDGVMLLADRAFPDWTVRVHGRANDRDGHWHCTLREGDVRDNDRVIGAGRSPVLSQAILAAVLRLMDETRTS